MMLSSIQVLLVAVFWNCCLQHHCVDAGIIQGFKKDIPSLNDLTPSFDHAIQQRKMELAGEVSTEELLEGDIPMHRAVQVNDTADVTDTTSVSAPRGNNADSAPGIDPTELSFMILMDEFEYSNGANSMSDIGIGTVFAFSGRIATKAEELGIASGSCTVTSDAKVELSYCTFYFRIDTDNFGGFGTAMVSGSTDEIGGRLLVVGTGGSLSKTQNGYSMIQFDPAGNPVIYVLLRLS